MMNDERRAESFCFPFRIHHSAFIICFSLMDDYAETYGEVVGRLSC